MAAYARVAAASGSGFTSSNAPMSVNIWAGCRVSVDGGRCAGGGADGKMDVDEFVENEKEKDVGIGRDRDGNEEGDREGREY
jgi:hypothetical protein